MMKKNNIKLVPIDEAYLVLHEAATKEIGIRGNDTFTITFSFVAGVNYLNLTLYQCNSQNLDLNLIFHLYSSI